MSETTPVLFVSHGAPTLVIEDIPAHRFLADLGQRFPAVKGIVCISAHWETERPAVSAIKVPGTIYDFYGFPAQLYKMDYPAPGSPEIAERVAGLIKGSGMRCDIDESRGVDHGAWVPLMLMFPRAEVPVVQLSIQHHLDPARHLELGKALTPLREEGILVLGSGGAVHPLGYFVPRAVDAPPEDWAAAFEEWLTSRVEAGDHEELVDYRSRAPFPERAHPRPDHYMPLMVAVGAAGDGSKGKRIHKSWYWGDLGMGAYQF